jgi:hypothetical protein
MLEMIFIVQHAFLATLKKVYIKKFILLAELCDCSSGTSIILNDVRFRSFMETVLMVLKPWFPIQDI